MNMPIWTPKTPQKSQMWHFMQYVAHTYQQNFNNYQELHQWSILNSADFWQSICNYFNITFSTPAENILNNYHDMIDARWFSGAEFNFAERLLWRRDDHPALISIDESGQRIQLSYMELHEQVGQCAAGLINAGVIAGDRIAAIMPNVTYTVIAMLATASIGAIWSACSTEFGADAAIDRLGQIAPKILFVCNGHEYNGKTHLELIKIQQVNAGISSLTHIVICPVINANIDLSSLPNALMWNDFIHTSSLNQFIHQPFNHPLYILFSSGTTGKPKCIIHGAGGTLLQHIKELGLHTDVKQTDTMFFYTTCGWMMWNWMVSSLALGATLILYEGSPTYPNANRLFQLIDDEQVSIFGTSPKFLSSVEHAQIIPAKLFNLTHMRCILSTGAPLLPEHYDFVYKKIKPNLQLSSISGGTDIVSCFALGNPMLPVYRGELQCLGLGMAIEIYNEQAIPISHARGELVCTKPFPSMPIGFWGDIDQTQYKKAYFSRFPGVWAQGDFAEITPHNGLIIYGRSDAILNPGGVRIGTAEIYQQVAKISEILDSVVIGQDWEQDVRIVLFVKLQPGLYLDELLKDKIRKTIRTHASPRHVPAKILQVGDIPRTINGKLVEVAVRQTVQGQDINNLSSLANPEALNDFQNRVELC